MFLHPLGLVALLGVPAVVALHLFRRRFRRELVSALFLWAEAGEVSLGGRRRERLVRSPSFWFEVAAAGLLGLAFAGPRGCDAAAERHLVVVLDGSAATGAVAPDGPLAGRAADEVRARIDAVGSGGRVTLIESGPHPRLLAGPGALPEEARRALDAFRPEAARHELAPAVALGRKIAGDGALLVVSPRFRPDLLPPEVELVAVGEPLENTAILRARRGAPSGGTPERIELSVAHYGARPATTALELLHGDEIVATRALQLDPGERRDVAFELPRPSSGRPPDLRARLVAGGALALDDTAWLVAPPPRTLAVGTTLGGEELRALGLARRGASGLARWLDLVPDSVEAPPEHAHVVLGPWPSTGGPGGPGGPGDGSGPGVALDPRAALDAGDARDDWIGPYLVEKRHPLLSGVTLDGVIWSAAEELALEGSPLVSAGNRPLLVEQRDGGRRLFRANLDPRRSTLARSPDWPILLTNLAAIARAELPGPERTNLATGEPFVYRARREATYRLLGPDLDRTIRAREVLVLEEDVVRPGAYELREGERSLCRFGVTFCDAAESDLTGLASGERDATAALAGIASGATPLERALVVAALALLALDWWWLSRRASAAAPAPARGDGLRPAGSGAR